jgi:hypothetical protein
MNIREIGRAALAFSLCHSLSAIPAHARTSANPDGRVVRDASGARTAPEAPKGDRASTPAAVAVDVPLPAGAELVGTTWYDLQDMGSLGRRIEVGADGRVHVTWEDEFCELGGGCPPNLAAPQPHPNRGMGYAYRDAVGTWNVIGKVTDTRMPVCCGLRDLAGGFGALALLPSGRVAIAQHLNEDGCDMHGYFQLEDAPGSALFRSYLTPVVSPSLLFPQVSANPNGSFTVLGEVPRGGMYDETESFRTSYLAAPGTFFACFGWQMGAWTTFAPPSLFRDGRPAFPSIAASSNGRVGVAVGDLGGNVYLIESSDGTFAAGTVTTRNLTNYSDAAIVNGDSTSLEYRPFIHCHVAYNDTTPNVVWSEWQARKIGAAISYHDWRSRIRRWSPQRGLETVYQVPAGIADRFDDIDNGLAGPIAGFNTLSVDWPQVGFSPDGSETYVAFLGYRDSQVDPTADAGLPGIVTGIGFGDIFCSLAREGAHTAPQNLSNTPATDERFFSLAPKNPGGRAHIVFQASATNEAGCAIIGDRGTTPGNLLRKIAYLAAPLTGSLLDVADAPGVRAPRLRVSPNPLLAHGQLRLEAEPAASARRLIVVDLGGRRIASLELPAGERAIEWSGRDDAGRPIAAGVYFARLEGQAAASSVRFVVAR